MKKERVATIPMPATLIFSGEGSIFSATISTERLVVSQNYGLNLTVFCMKTMSL